MSSMGKPYATLPTELVMSVLAQACPRVLLVAVSSVIPKLVAADRRVKHVWPRPSHSRRPRREGSPQFETW
ncbi:hypothetical protein BCR44DRAFT_46613 [Catenaria anguillulae PL171]|uniref:F-box domain-containing protein n=1 Tax=Catenaria anguillulae PL171 TaxID=765915 RepID=A0A1Y2HV99_9FUNG|nr:hypothetical protein BCR44DRAFT_46613 [Catenaria anguillulae PL171]